MNSWIVNGTIVDGTGAPSFSGDLRLVNGRIAEIVPSLSPPADASVIDASGLVVAPGFIDLHSHSDVALIVDPVVPCKLNQGITLELLGQDGMSVSPLTDDVADLWRHHLSGLAGSYDLDWDWRTFDDYLQRLTPTAANVASLVGHGTLRLNVIGMENRPATTAEIDRMAGLLREALDAGAFGLSGGLVYTPGAYAGYDELVALNRIVAEANKIWVVHIRYEGDRIVEGLNEMFRLVDETGVTLHVSHFKPLGRRNWGRGPEIVGLIEGQRARGRDVTVDQYPYAAGSTMLSAILPPWANADGPDGLLRYLRNPSALTRMDQEIATGLPDWEGFVEGTGWENIRISDIASDADSPLIGKSIAEIAVGWDVTPFQAATRLLLEAELGVSMIVHAMSEDDVATILKAPWRTGGTDALLGGKPHPRSYGSFPRVLGHYVRDEALLSLELAIHQMTGAAAARLRLPNRGTIAPGNWADLCLFDPVTIRDTATYEQPEQLPEGIAWIFVNGEPVIHNRQPTGRLPGQVLRQAPD